MRAFLLLGALAVGCSSSSTPPICEGAADREACLTDHYVRGASEGTVKACAGGSKLPIEGRKELAFHFSGPMGDGAAQANGRILQRYYQPYDLTFFTRELASPVGFDSVLDGELGEVERRVKEEGLSFESTKPEDKARIQKIVGEVIGKNLREFVQSVSNPVQARMHVVVVSRIVSTELAKQLQLGGTVVGLGVSPKLFRDAAAARADSSANLFDLFSLPEDFTPVLFVGHGDLTSFGAGIVGEVTVAHEAGHAFGLRHTTDPKNLMFPRVDVTNQCLPTLSDLQIDSLREASGLTDGSLEALTIVDGTAHFVNLVERTIRALSPGGAAERRQRMESVQESQ